MTAPLPTVCAILVTYADRATLCSRVAGRLAQIGVSRIVIVDNASAERSSRALEELAAHLPQVEVLHNEANLGSGGGFRRALEAAFEANDEFLLFLDDDNLPQPDCLTRLLSAHRLLEPDHPSGIVLYANRGSTRPTDTDSFRWGFTKYYPRNSFCAFSLAQRSFGRLQRVVGVTGPASINYPVVRVHFGPYGGMFGRLQIFKRIGFPRSDYYIYADDHEYATRMDACGVAQFLIEAARIDDLDVSLKPGATLLADVLSPDRLYYQIRNHTHLSQSFAESRLYYNINKYSFLIWQVVKAWRSWLTSPVLTIQRLRLLRRAVKDGEAGQLGQRIN